MKLKFIGKNGSKGFINGQVYDLDFFSNESSIGIVHKRKIFGLMGEVYVQYSSPQALAENWEKIEDEFPD